MAGFSMQHYYVSVDSEEHKTQALCNLYNTNLLHNTKTVIYVNTKRTMDMLADMMRFRVQTLFSASAVVDMDMSSRDAVMQEFHSSASGVFLTTDPLAAKLDLRDSSIVIYYDLPSYDVYMNRVQKMGHNGAIINIVTQDTNWMVSDLQNHYNLQMQELPANS